VLKDSKKKKEDSRYLILKKGEGSNLKIPVQPKNLSLLSELLF